MKVLVLVGRRRRRRRPARPRSRDSRQTGGLRQGRLLSCRDRCMIMGLAIPRESWVFLPGKLSTWLTTFIGIRGKTLNLMSSEVTRILLLFLTNI